MQIAVHGDRLVVSGALGEDSLIHLRRELVTRLAPGVRLVVDLTWTTFLPSAAIGIVVRAARSARAMGGDVTFAAAPDSYAGHQLTLLRLPFGPSVREVPEPYEGDGSDVGPDVG